ncbi:MAG TPA: hypothetical protein VFV70_16060 [Hyphomonadaceae bacterium]|nr:hypothetical protein [Hyphomonadaceae bacterium]
MAEQIRVDLPVFLHDGDVAIGAVHDVKTDSIEIYIENGGDFSIPRSAVRDVHFNKVILDGRKLSKDVHDAIGRARAAEDDEDHEETDE